MPSKLLAVDIVLLLPPDIAKEMVILSNHLNDSYGEKIRLNTVNRFPHISLLMGVVQESDMESIREILNRLARVNLPLSLTMTGLVSKSTSSAIEIQPIPELAKLQNELLEAMRPLLQDSVAPEMFVEPPTEKTMDWVRNYVTSHAHYPHITVGPTFDNETYTNLKKFTVSQLALAHLGFYCTCCKLLVVSEP